MDTKIPVYPFIFAGVKCISNIILFITAGIILLSCKKDKFTTDSSATVHMSQDSVLFDTVFTTIGSSTKNIRIVNNNSQKIKIASLTLQSGGTTGFKLNVDGVPGTSFSDLEIAAHDSMYIFIQVNVNPTNQNSPLIISDAINLTVNGNQKSVYLEAWGQDAYYHRPTTAIKFADGSYLAYSTVSSGTNVTVTWTNDKPHVIYGYLVVDSTQKLIMNAGTRVYFNYKAALWVYRYGELQVLGQKGNEVTFQGARRELDYADEPGQWDRIWINEGSTNNIIDYAIIKNGYIGVQAELFGSNFYEPKKLTITNTKIQNMSLWGIYGLAFNIYGGNNVVSNCQEYSMNLQLGGSYKFYQCTFSNFWSKDKQREKPTVNISNYDAQQVLPDTLYMGNCIIDGTLANELNLDLNYSNSSVQPKITFSSSWIKTNGNITDATKFIDVRAGSTSLNYTDKALYNFEPLGSETQHRNFGGPNCS
ncbi:MAG: hypothetical protein ACXVC7_15395, partial [Bacteroidia bacterium]